MYALHSRIDVVVNAGGILENAIRIVDMNVDEFDALWRVNVRGTFSLHKFSDAGCMQRDREVLSTFARSLHIGRLPNQAMLPAFRKGRPQIENISGHNSPAVDELSHCSCLIARRVELRCALDCAQICNVRNRCW